VKRAAKAAKRWNPRTAETARDIATIRLYELMRVWSDWPQEAMLEVQKLVLEANGAEYGRVRSE
jgi:hypothetical protein